MNREQSRCSLCGGRLKAERITYTQVNEGRVAIVTDVPAEVCSQCGEQYLSPETVEAVRAAIETEQAPATIEVPVYPFPHA